MLADLRGDADLVIDTSNLNVHQLHRQGREPRSATADATRAADHRDVSFGFKYGIPVDADFVADMRFLPNPYWVPELRAQTGLDPDVSDYVNGPAGRRGVPRPATAGCSRPSADGYLAEGKRFMTVAIGCTGGKHRSVAMAEEIAARLVDARVETLARPPRPRARVTSARSRRPTSARRRWRLGGGHGLARLAAACVRCGRSPTT